MIRPKEYTDSSKDCPQHYRSPKGVDGGLSEALLHVSLNRFRFKEKNMQQLKVLKRPLRV
jgi:hypothetical protein